MWAVRLAQHPVIPSIGSAPRQTINVSVVGPFTLFSDVFVIMLIFFRF
jgi:hypothetical protein